MADNAHPAPEAAASGGMPQLDISTWSSQIFWLVITFGVLYFVLSKFVLPNLASGIGAREDRIADDLDAASTMQREAEEAEKAYLQSLADARAKAHNVAETTRQAIDSEIAGEIEAADAEAAIAANVAEARIRDIRTAALANIDIIAADTAQEIVKRLTGTALTSAMVKAVVKTG